MGIYLNPGNSGFSEIRNGTYIDKSGLISLVNQVIDTPSRLTCVSRPRRFGKSFAAKMLCAYYDKTCDSAPLFDDLEISGHNSYRQQINKYDVIYLDMTNIMGKAGDRDMVSFIQTGVTEELRTMYPTLKTGNAFDETLLYAAELTGNKFIAIIDEWDAPLREMPQIQNEYLKFLRTLFKSSGTTDKIFGAAYMTGILPIKKDGSESAISDFWEYTMLEPGEFQKYIGFTEEEVRQLCEGCGMSFEEAKRWYEGYSFDGKTFFYNPYSIMKAVTLRKYKSYWRLSSAADALEDYIAGDFDGLFSSVLELLGGFCIPVEVNGFNNDLADLRNRDDVLTLLIHLGYLSYDDTEETVRIPNEEIRLEFEKSVREVKSTEALKRMRESRQLLIDTVNGKEEAVAAQIEKIHAEMADPLHYNSEQALRSVIQIAYYSYPDYYVKFEELPSGDGYADMVYLPKRGSRMPVLVVELKWNKSAEGAIQQMKEKRYFDALKDYGGDILLVGINYDKNSKKEKRKHTCVIERI